MKRKRVGYAKLGRSMPLSIDRCKSLGGDVEMIPTVKLLAERNPDVDFVLVGRNSGEYPHEVGLPSNVINPWTEWSHDIRKLTRDAGLTGALDVDDLQRLTRLLTDATRSEFAELDDIIVWLGQHGTTNTPLPSISNRDVLTRPHDSSVIYGSYILQNVNEWREVDPHTREEIFLNADVRNYVKFRDAKWPWWHSVLGQYNQVNRVKHERYGDARSPDQCGFYPETVDWVDDGVWRSEVKTAYTRLEISALIPGTPFGDLAQFSDDFDRPHNFGMVVNETRREVNPLKSRLNALRGWVLDLDPGFIHGVWTDSSQRELGREIEPVPVTEYFRTIQSTRSTFTTPASGSGWATAKPWESFAAGVVCFFHPLYDDQNNILWDADSGLRDFLRVTKPSELKSRVKLVSEDEETWRWAVNLQRQHFERAVRDLQYLETIEKRLGVSRD